MFAFSVFDDMTQCSTIEVERLRGCVSLQRRELSDRFKPLSKKFECLKSFEMLELLFSNSSFFQGMPLSSFDYCCANGGKPFFRNIDNFHFSISHCKRAIVVAIADFPLGVDVESFRNVNDSFIDYVMNEEEALAIRSSDSSVQSFAKLWTRKEAVLKLRGTGINCSLKDLLPADENIVTCVNTDKEYAFSVAVPASVVPPVLDGENIIPRLE